MPPLGGAIAPASPSLAPPMGGSVCVCMLPVLKTMCWRARWRARWGHTVSRQRSADAHTSTANLPRNRAPQPTRRERERGRDRNVAVFLRGHIVPPGVSVISHRKPISQLPCDYRLVTSQVGMCHPQYDGLD